MKVGRVARFLASLALGRAVVLGIAFAGCKDAPPGRRSPPPAIVEKPLFWLRDTEVLDKPSGQSVGKVVDPVLVELTGDGRVRFTAPRGRAARRPARPARDRAEVTAAFIASR
jgi:hypothetical protein